MFALPVLLGASGCAAHRVSASHGGGPRVVAARSNPTVMVSQARAGAARAFDAGVAAYARGDYNEAAENFQRAYHLRAAPIALWNMARSYERAGQADRAAQAYVEYLRADRDAPVERQRAAGEALARLR